MVKLEDIKPDDRMEGIEPDCQVIVLHVKAAGPDAVNLTYELPSGDVLKTLFRDDEAKISVATTSSQFTFTAAPEAFKLAHLFNPMMAIQTSTRCPTSSPWDETVLPKRPLRYVLAVAVEWSRRIRSAA